MRRGPIRPTAPSAVDRIPYVAPTSDTSWSWPSGELGTDVHDSSSRLERLAHELEHRGTSLEQLEQPHRGLELLGARLFEQAGGAADEDLRTFFRPDLEQALSDESEKRTLTGCELRRVEPAAHRARAEALAHEPLVQILGGPGQEAAIGRLLEPEDPLRHASCRGDDDHHDARRLECQHLDVTNGRRLEGRGGDEREKPGCAREHLGRRSQRVLDLVSHPAEIDTEPVRTPFQRLDQLLGIEAVPALGGDSAGRRMRMGQETDRFELGELAAYGRGRHLEPRLLDERARPDGLSGRDVLLDHTSENLAFAGGKHHSFRW